MKRDYSCLLFIFFSPDINECMLSPPVCEQSCTDTAGSFVCGCNPGFVLNQDDESSCDGEYCSVYQSGHSYGNTVKSLSVVVGGGSLHLQVRYKNKTKKRFGRETLLF